MSKKTWATSKTFVAIVWVIAITVRLYGATTKAQIYDIGTFEAWSRTFWSHGASNFFNVVWSDYLPLPIFTFAPISILSDLFHAPFGLVFKLIHIILELLLISLIPNSAFIAKILLLLSPAMIGDNSFWGQVDVIPALLSVVALTSNSAVLFGLAVAYKPIMVLIAPLLWINSVKKGDKWYHFPLLSILIFFATGIPTGGLHFVTHIFTRVFDQVGTYPYLTINAFNFWALHPNLSWVSDTTSVLSISGKTLGLILFLTLSFVSLIHWRKTDYSPKYIPRLAATILVLFFTFTTRMHERHLLFGLPFLALAAIFDSWLLMPFVILSCTFTLNLYGAYYWVMHNQTWPFSLSIISLISWVTTLTSIMLATVWSWPKLFKSIVTWVRTNLILVLVLTIATSLRFINISNPSTYIFDEVYHAFTAREYLHNRKEAWEWWTTPPKDVAYEWTHPPVAKYGMVVGMLLFGENSLGWRVGSAAAGVISIYGIYLLVHALTKNKNIALLSSFFVSIEGLHIAQSRIAMNDMYMLVFLIFALYSAVKSRWKLASVLYGLSLASKWSALYGIVPLLFIFLRQYGLKKIFFAFRLLFITVLIYIITFTPFILAGHSWAQWWELHRQMWYYHTHLVATHAYQSTPLQWVFDLRPVWYFVKYGTLVISNIYALGNPIIYWLGLISIILGIRKLFTYPYALFLLTYAIFTLPWVFSPRIMFFYHYLPSSTFLCIILSSWLSDLTPRTRNSVLVLCLIGLIVISPMLYAIPTSTHYWNILFTLMPNWK